MPMSWPKQELCAKRTFTWGKKIHSFVKKKTILRASETNKAGPLSLALPELGPSSLTPWLLYDIACVGQRANGRRYDSLPGASWSPAGKHLSPQSESEVVFIL